MSEQDDSRKDFFMKWNAENKNRPWEIVFPEVKKQNEGFGGHKLSEEAYKRYISKMAHPSQPLGNTPRDGQIIYTPHDCQFPDPWETPIGAIWECHGYRDGICCYDLWIVAVSGGNRYWELFKRNIR